jgi:hypothetical protein
MEHFEKALEVDSESIDAVFGLIQTIKLQSLSVRKAFVSDLQKTLELDPGNYKFLVQLALFELVKEDLTVTRLENGNLFGFRNKKTLTLEKSTQIRNMINRALRAKKDHAPTLAAKGFMLLALEKEKLIFQKGNDHEKVL